MNAVSKAADLVRRLSSYKAPGSVDPGLGLPPRLTVTRISGGESYSIIPDKCTVGVDIRLTTTFGSEAATRLLKEIISQVDNELPAPRCSEYLLHESWPAYQLDDETSVRNEPLRAARRQFSRKISPEVSSPSNIDNYLAKLGIAATAGLGVRYEGLHATNEKIELASIPMVQATYHEAVFSLLHGAAEMD